MAVFLQMKDVVKRYGNKLSVDHMNLEVNSLSADEGCRETIWKQAVGGSYEPGSERRGNLWASGTERGRQKHVHQYDLRPSQGSGRTWIKVDGIS